MRDPRRSFASALIAALLLAGRPAHAVAAVTPAVPVPVLATGPGVRAGDDVEIRWSPADGRVEEFELLLSLDGGRSWHVRVSPSVPPDRMSYRWRVPNLPSADARIRIRMRVDGREVEGEAGPRFAIAGDVTKPLARAVFSEGAWWTGLGLAIAPPAGFGRADEPRLGATHASLLVEDSPRVGLPAPATAVVLGGTLPCHATRPRGAAPRSRTPEVVPLRN